MATHNHERRAALEEKRNATEAARREKGRKRNDHDTKVASKEQTIPKLTTKTKRADNTNERKKTDAASGPQKNATKRKQGAHTDQPPRKRAQTENYDAAARVRQHYRKPEGTNADQRKKTKAASGPQTIQKNASKRKRAAQTDESPRKKVQVKNDDAAARVRQQYQEPEGMRKSRRIAGQPAESSGSPSAGQYVRVNDEDDAQVSDVEPTTTIDTPVTGNTNAADEPSDQDVRRIEQRPQDVREVFARTIGTHRIVRGMTKEYTAFTDRVYALNHGRNGLLELEHKYRQLSRDMESSEEEKEAVRSLHAKRLGQIKRHQAYVDRLTTPLRAMIAMHTDRNDRIYESIGTHEDHSELTFLPPEFWTAYKNCRTAYTACKDIKSKIHVMENERFDMIQQLDERMIASVSRDDRISTREADEAQNAPFGESTENQNLRIRKLGGRSQGLQQLQEILESARDKQYEEESRLNQIAEAAFVAAGYLRAVDDPEEIELHRRVPSDVGQRNTGRRSNPTGPVELNEGSSSRSPDKSALADKVRRARKNLQYHRKRLQDARWQPLSDAGSLDSDAQGEPRVRRWIKRTGELREAENEYRSARHRAQHEGAMSDSDQSSNFRDHISDGYGASTLKSYGYPMAAKKKNRIQNWMSPSMRHRKKQQVRQAAGASDKEEKWIDRIESMRFGEDLEGREVDRRKERIDMWEKERDRLREEGPFENAENDFHPQNSGMATGFVESGQYEDDDPMELDEDDSEDIRGSPSNPRVLFNPDALTADLIDSDHQAAQWIEKHFNGNGGSGQPLLYDPSAPLIDYAIDGYDGANMDGIE